MSKIYKTIILPEAQQDIRNIILYIARDLAAPKAALDLQDAFEKEIISLSTMPERFRTVDEQPWKDAGIRKTRVKNYYLLYNFRSSTNSKNNGCYICRQRPEAANGRKILEIKDNPEYAGAVP